jgi:hypothetical protein
MKSSVIGPRNAPDLWRIQLNRIILIFGIYGKESHIDPSELLNPNEYYRRSNGRRRRRNLPDRSADAFR